MNVGRYLRGEDISPTTQRIKEPMKTWVVQVQLPTKMPFWFGNLEAPSRPAAKAEARRFLANYLPLDAKIISVAEGYIKVDFHETRHSEHTGLNLRDESAA